jgi:hypothetical protein
MSIFPSRYPLSVAPGRDVCPHLGMTDDSRTCLAYPSEWNHCHHARPPAPVKLEYQRITCLLAMHTVCPVFQTTKVKRLPPDLRARRRKPGAGRLTTLLVLSVIVLGFLLWVAWWRNSGTLFGLTFGVPQQPAQAGSLQETKLSPTPESIETNVTTSVSLQATQSLPAPTSVRYIPSLGTLKCGYELEDRVEFDHYTLIIHHVARGESMDLLAAQYNTSLRAIRAVNHFLPSPLWKDLVIIIPTGSATVSDLPAFEPYFVLDPVASLHALAGQYSLSEEDLMKYNNLDTGCMKYVGWFLIPHVAGETP